MPKLSDDEEWMKTEEIQVKMTKAFDAVGLIDSKVIVFLDDYPKVEVVVNTYHDVSLAQIAKLIMGGILNQETTISGSGDKIRFEVKFTETINQ